MPVKIRLARRGRGKAPFYHIVIADSRAKRDGKFIEKIGSYNPMTVPATIELDRDKAFDWLNKGAQPTYTARAILRFKGVLYRSHLMRGVKKGALTEEQAMKLYEDFVKAKEEKVAARVQKTAEERALYHKQVSGEIKPPKEKAPAALAEEFREGDDAEATPAEEATEVTETATEEVATESPAAEETPAEEMKEEAPAEEDETKAAAAVAAAVNTDSEDGPVATEASSEEE